MDSEGSGGSAAGGLEALPGHAKHAMTRQPPRMETQQSHASHSSHIFKTWQYPGQSCAKMLLEIGLHYQIHHTQTAPVMVCIYCMQVAWRATRTCTWPTIQPCLLVLLLFG